MSDNDMLLRKAETLSNGRRFMLFLNAVTYVAWMIGLAVNTGTSEGGYNPIWRYLQTAGMITWVLSLIGVAWTILAMRRHKHIAALVDDERTYQATGRAFMIGYIVLLFPLAGIYTASYFTQVDIRFVIPIMLAIGVATPSLTYVLFFRN